VLNESAEELLTLNRRNNLSAKRTSEILILCIDDDLDVLNLLKTILTGAGYSVITAENGRLGLHEARLRQPDLILMDVMMPEIDGYAVCSQLQENPETVYIPVLFLTALDDEINRAKSFAAGAVDHIAKPVRKDILLNKIGEQLKTKLRWQKLKERVGARGETVSPPAIFSQFKQSLVELFELPPEIRDRLSGVTPFEIYKICEFMNISQRQLTAWIADFLSFPVISTIDPERLLLGVIPVSFAKENRVIAMLDEKGERSFILCNPFDLSLMDALKKLFGLKSETILYLAAPEDIDALFRQPDAGWRIKRPLDSNAEQAEKILDLEDINLQEDEADITQVIDSEVIALVNRILVEAYTGRASDIHFDSGMPGQPFHVRFRVDGICHTAYAVPEKAKRGVISRIKIMSNLDISERRKPQSGKFMVRIRNEKVEFRVEVTPTVDNNENIVLRILAKSKPVAITELGLSPYNLRAFESMITKPQGVVLCVGPTGSGKTTTLHSALGHINKPEITIWTAEDPVEIRQPGLKQVQINNKIGFTFSEALRSFMRADPDVIMIGEMRDVETAKITLEASLTGHLVFSTLHTNSAAETITRIMDMGIPFYNFAGALLGIVAQRLTRRLCEQCKKPYHPDADEYDNLMSYYHPGWAKTHGLPDYTPDLTLWKRQGCSYCENQGYRGRVAIHEIIVASDAVKKAIRQNPDVENLIEVALTEGMRTLRMDGVMKILEGVTDFDQVSRVCL
jgi:type II secretory ATPase GspE/PulE/Tfp pilus assembly ATPase PilB-like protein/FixJ family two-component response regulator